MQKLADIKNPPAGILLVDILNASVPPMDTNGYCDPYVITKFALRKFQSPTIKKTLSPTWNHRLQIIVHPEELNYDVEFELWDWDKLSSDDFIATLRVPLHEITSAEGQEFHKNLKFDIPKKKKKCPEELYLNVKLQFYSKELMERTFWDHMVDYFDTSRDKFIDIEELEVLLHSLIPNPEVVEKLSTEELFQVIDTNGDGKLSAEEIYEFMTSSNNPVIKEIRWATNELSWNAFLKIESGMTVADVILNEKAIEVEAEIQSVSKENVQLKKQILVQNRETGKLEVELIPNYIRVSMKLMYSSRVGKATVAHVKGILNKMTIRQGKAYSTPSSRNEIRPFIEFHHLSIKEMLNEDLDSYANFNEFFYRKLKPSARPVAGLDDERIIVSPADCRLNVFPTIEEAQEFWVKGTGFNLLTLLQDPDLAAEFEGCSMLIARLAPQDYHRYHSPVSGTIGPFNEIPGTYYTVNPIAINQQIDVYGQNRRLITVIESAFGRVVFVAVGATMVGSICMTVSPGDTVKKGDELGYFAFGGSTCLVLFPKNYMQFDRDLLINSAKPIETLVKVNTQIGVVPA